MLEAACTPMEITDAMINSSVGGLAFGAFEPFVTGDDLAVSSFYSDVLASLKSIPGVAVHEELDHYGSGYASYLSVFLYPSDGRSCRDFPDHTETTGILVYMSRLAPIWVYGASAEAENKNGKGSSSGFIEAGSLGTLPDGDWVDFLASITRCLASYGIELLHREPLMQPARDDIIIPTVFDGPYYVFDTLFYWCD